MTKSGERAAQREREAEVLDLFADGFSVVAISRQLKITTQQAAGACRRRCPSSQSKTSEPASRSASTRPRLVWPCQPLVPTTTGCFSKH